jgi:hypothetical protein
VSTAPPSVTIIAAATSFPLCSSLSPRNHPGVYPRHPRSFHRPCLLRIPLESCSNPSCGRHTATALPLTLAGAFPDSTTGTNRTLVSTHFTPGGRTTKSGSPSPPASRTYDDKSTLVRLFVLEGLFVRIKGIVVKKRKFPGTFVDKDS